ncbi:NUDIX domain-containing protein [Paracoccus stylophorae]|uniref:NUDIX domain-containing protein n=2 Tax=Paracoccus stylophorae TaxID=659350 RepID=A0ABY7T1V9_9RHOB|nr:NUDIX domain-containing protein [Paracoccus stylophorae]
MRTALGLAPGTATEPVAGRLIGGMRAGIEAGTWPVLAEGAGEVAAIRVATTPAFRRYAAVMGLKAVDADDGGPPLMGLQAQSDESGTWSATDWPGDLAAAIAHEVLAAPDRLDAEQVAARLPMIGVWAHSRLRAAASPPSGGELVARRGADDVRLHGRQEPYSGYFAVDVWKMSHRTHAGGFTPTVRREGFVMGDAVVVLPWDPVRDRLLVIEQFRVGPAFRRDPRPWLLEAIAGRIDAGEGIEDAARREAQEEAGLKLGRLFPAIHHYPTPGAVTEYLYLYVGIADLPDGSAGVHGLETETEDIRGHLVGRADLVRMVLDGQITNGPLAMLVLWLEHRREGLLRELAGS